MKAVNLLMHHQIGLTDNIMYKYDKPSPMDSIISNGC